MSSGVIICMIICGTIIALTIIDCFHKPKQKTKPKDIKYDYITSTQTTLNTVLSGLAKYGKKIVGISLYYGSPDTIRYLIIYEVPVDE